MSETQPEQPQWNLLPEHPITFFQLESGFDRKTLKRAYNRLIKKFKPDKHPREFQLIRQAYEFLEGKLNADPKILRKLFAKEAAETQTETPESGAIKPPADPKLEEKPQTILQRLKSREPKSAHDHYCIIVFSEALGLDERAVFGSILEGLLEFPRYIPLLDILAEYLTKRSFEENLAILPKLAVTLKNGHFYGLTLGIWLEALQHLEKKEWFNLLKRCESELIGYIDPQKAVFHAHTAPYLAFEYSTFDQWVAFIFKNQELLPYDLKPQLDFLGYLMRYLEIRDQFLNGSNIREELDLMFRNYCTGSDAKIAFQQFSRQILALQTRPSNLVEAFGLDENLMPVYDLLVCIGEKVRTRMDTAVPETEIATSLPKWYGPQIRKSIGTYTVGWIPRLVKFSLCILVVFLWTLPLDLFAAVLGPLTLMGFVPFWVILVVAVQPRIYRHIVSSSWPRRLKNRYLKSTRPAIITLLSLYNYDPTSIAAIHTRSDISSEYIVGMFMGRDEGLWIYHYIMWWHS